MSVQTTSVFTTVNQRNIELIQVAQTGLDLPKKTYILRSPALEEILFNRGLVGQELQKASFRASRAFFEMLKPEIDQYKFSERIELVNLTGSLYYYLSGAHGKVFNNPLGQNFAGIRRKPIKGKIDEKGKQVFDVEVNYTSFEAPGKICFMGETIATAVSSEKGLKKFLPWATQNGLKKLIIFSICGSKDGAVRLNQFCAKNYPDIELVFVFGLGLLGLGNDGTALMWRPDNGDEPITIPEYLEKGNEVYLPGECAIGDWGLRFKNPNKYLWEWQKERIRLANK